MSGSQIRIDIDSMRRSCTEINHLLNTHDFLYLCANGFLLVYSLLTFHGCEHTRPGGVEVGMFC